MSYNLDAIKAKINALSGNNKGASGDRPRLKWWKPELGQHDVRFAPYRDANGQPFQEIYYYDNAQLADRRFPTATQFDLPDPIFDILTELRKDRSKESWMVWKNLQSKERYYAPIIVRGQEDKGIQVWELNSRLVKDIYSVLAHPDYKDEDLMDPTTGYDFTVTVTPTDKTFNGHPVKEIKLQPRRKASPMMTKDEDREKLLKSMPDLVAYFKSQVKSPEEAQAIIENFIAGQDGSSSSGEDNSSSDEGDSSESSTAEMGTAKETASASAQKVKKTKKSVEDAFEGL